MKIFLTTEILQLIFLFQDEYPNLNKILYDKSTLILDVDDVELDSILDDSENDITKVLLGYDLDHEAHKGIIDTFKNNAKSMMDIPRAMFFLDIDDDTAKKWRIQYGILVISTNNIDDSIFDKGVFRCRLDASFLEGGSVQSNWLKLLQGMEMLPSNSLVISDSYLFSTSNVKIEDCIRNIEGLLDAVLPYTFDDTYHIVLFTEPISIDNKKIEQAMGDIKAFICSKRSYNIVLEAVFYKSLHQRKLISNYNVILFDKGIVALKEKNNMSQAVGTNYIQCSTIYENACNSLGQSDYDITTKDLQDLLGWYNECKLLCNSKIKDTSKKILGTNNKDKTLNNRLMNCL